MPQHTHAPVVVVTGATGFIGARIVERLVLGGTATVRGLTTTQSHLPRLALLPASRLSVHVGDIRDRRHLAAALQDADVVVHCAFGASGPVENRWDVTVEGTRAVVETAGERGVQRLVHVSTIDVYSPAIDYAFDESAPRLEPNPDDLEYEQQKAAAESIVAAEFDNYVVVQPGIVYGPFGKQWTTVQLERLRAGVEGLPSRGQESGICNAIYVDDVADAVVAATDLRRASASGTSVLLNGPEVVQWSEFFDGLRTIAKGIPSHPDPSNEAAEPAKVEEWEAALYLSRAQADAGLAQRVLEWKPKVPLDLGMSATREWFQWMNRPFS